MMDKVKYWIDIAEEDLSVAKILIKASKFLYTGFMCHQAVEKGLKAVIAKNCVDDEIPPKIHHLTRLAEVAGVFDILTEEQKSYLADLNPLNIEARYPEYKNKIAMALSNESCEKLITDTEEMLCWIKRQL